MKTFQNIQNLNINISHCTCHHSMPSQACFVLSGRHGDSSPLPMEWWEVVGGNQCHHYINRINVAACMGMPSTKQAKQTYSTWQWQTACSSQASMKGTAAEKLNSEDRDILRHCSSPSLFPCLCSSSFIHLVMCAYI